MLGRGEGGLRGIGVSGSGYNEVLVLEVLNVVDHVELRRSEELPAPWACISFSRSRCHAVVPGVLACAHV